MANELEETRVKLRAATEVGSQGADQAHAELQVARERFEVEIASLKNKCHDLDKLCAEFELKCASGKTREAALEQRSTQLELELERLSERATTDEMHAHKVLALEQANRVLEAELSALKGTHAAELAQVRTEHERKLIELEETNIYLEELLEKERAQVATLVKSLKFLF